MPQVPIGFGFEAPTELPSSADLPPKLPTDLWLGALINEQSLVIQLVEPDSPAEKAGLSAGDRVIGSRSPTTVSA